MAKMMKAHPRTKSPEEKNIDEKYESELAAEELKFYRKCMNEKFEIDDGLCNSLAQQIKDTVAEKAAADKSAVLANDFVEEK